MVWLIHDLNNINYNTNLNIFQAVMKLDHFFEAMTFEAYFLEREECKCFA